MPLTIQTLREILHNPFLSDFLKLKRPVTHWSRQKGATEAWVLKTLHDLPDGLHERINARATLAQQIAAHKSPDGMLYLEESGMDCDCVRYSGRIHCIPATLQAYKKLEDDTYKWSDGPFNLRLVTQAEAESAQYQSRDLALEAFENGHPHHITFDGE